METLFERKWWDYSSTTYGKWKVEYEHRRSGSDMQYRFKWTAWITSGAWYYNAMKLPIYLNNTNVETVQVKYYNDGEKGWTYTGTTGWYTVSNKTSGTTPAYFKIVDTGGYAQAGWSVKDTTETYNLYVDPAKSELGTISNFTIGNNITIPITKYSSSFTDNLEIKYGNTTIKTINNISNGATVSFTNNELNTIYGLMSTVNSGTFTFNLSTYNGGTSVGSSSKTATGSITNANPTFTASQISYQDTNSSVVAITTNNQHIVRNNSTLQVSFTGATGNKGAIISRYEVTFNGSTQNKDSASTINYGTVNLSSNADVTIKVVDSRGNSVTVSKTITIFDWVLPSAVIEAQRVNNYEDTTNIKVNVTISSVNSKNAIQSIKYRYKKVSDTNYGSYTTINNNQTYQITIDKLYAWNFQIVIQDKFGTTTYNITVAKGMPIMFIDIDKLSVGIDCFPSKNNSLEADGIAISKNYAIGSIMMTDSNTNPGTTMGGTWSSVGTITVGSSTIYYWKRTA